MTAKGSAFLTRDQSRRLRWWRWLYVDEALVMAGAQFREVALALLMLALWPNPKSYALALLAVMLPGIALARVLGAVADRLPPKWPLVASYAVRAGAVLALGEARTVIQAVAALLVLSVGSEWAQVTAAHYQADAGDPGRTPILLARLRAVGSVASSGMPLAAGVAIGALGRGLGFDVSAAAYGLAGLALSQLPWRPPARVPSTPRMALTASGLGRLRRQMAVQGVLMGLAWIANVLYTAYILVTLGAGPVGFGLALGIWYAAGLAAAWCLPRVRVERPEGVVAGLILVMGLAWAVMTQPVPFGVVAALGVPEGFATWLMTDVLQTRVLAMAPPTARGALVGQSRAWIAGGRAAGLAAAIAVPAFARVHGGFLVLAALAGVLLVAWAASAAASPGAARAGPEPRG